MYAAGRAASWVRPLSLPQDSEEMEEGKESIDVGRVLQGASSQQQGSSRHTRGPQDCHLLPPVSVRRAPQCLASLTKTFFMWVLGDGEPRM